MGCICACCILFKGALEEEGDEERDEEEEVRKARKKTSLGKKMTRSLSRQLKEAKIGKTADIKSPEQVLFQKSVVPGHAERGSSKDHCGSQGSNSGAVSSFPSGVHVSGATH